MEHPKTFLARVPCWGVVVEFMEIHRLPRPSASVPWQTRQWQSPREAKCGQLPRRNKLLSPVSLSHSCLFASIFLLRKLQEDHINPNTSAFGTEKTNVEQEKRASSLNPGCEHLIILKSEGIKIVSGEGNAVRILLWHRKFLYFIRGVKMNIFLYLDFPFCCQH